MCRDLPERLRAARAAADITQALLGRTLGLTESTIANWERGRSEPGAGDLAGLARALRVSVDWLLTGSPLPHRFERCPHDVPYVDRCVACEAVEL